MPTCTLTVADIELFKRMSDRALALRLASLVPKKDRNIRKKLQKFACRVERREFDIMINYFTPQKEIFMKGQYALIRFS